ncbi:TetR/AcrR family transcriptional regulator [Frondihabitans australicus]|uniref:TetR family transcriptional regulator n=1 Tax=Frondihabitans australicus TaxID=386892 RepID=A0A495IM70_9MICO|nr:TetR/AcrR family transcriptional regulator [Frondihabitans australicus]RKR76518.1 TetR family transcriptional regulator [Frondihabitans australicus]
MQTKIGEAAARGRPRSETVRLAVLMAVDDLLVEEGYEAMTMKGIAERAGVGRQTVYRWWSTKAEILYEACVVDAGRDLAAGADDPGDLDAFRRRVAGFLASTDAGASYLALLAAAQLDPAVATLMRGGDPVRAAACEALRAAPGDDPDDIDDAVAALLGPLVYAALTGP